uniref:Interleukin 17 receptor B n=1 Tax=Larimichthys crocea TaxID=215358 RepID=A0A1L5J0Q1_LARCR|nr:interleukin 17 receptor B [Larimichthys crocea]
MFGVTLIICVSCVVAHAASHEIGLECKKFYGPPPVGTYTPHPPMNLRVELVTMEEGYLMNISWAVKLDASTQFLTGTRILLDRQVYHCEYKPPLSISDLPGLKQKWFHYLVKALSGRNTIQVANLPLPLPGSGNYYEMTTIKVPKKPTRRLTVPTVKTTAVEEITISPVPSRRGPDNVNFPSIAMAIFGGLASLMILGSCYIIYRLRGANFATSLGFKVVPTSPMVPTPVLVVYPAKNSTFQRAVVALAELLQGHGGCSVAVDMWQQGKIAELGPMRWLAEQAKAAERVLIVCPQETPSDSPLNHSLPEPSIPAAAHDLYPLILNMVVSHAKNSNDLAKFWVVQLGKQHPKRPSNLALGLRACKTFCLMKDLNKLCRNLQSQRQEGKKIFDMIFRPGIEKNAGKLREAVEKLDRHQSSIFKVEPLKSVVTTI